MMTTELAALAERPQQSIARRVVQFRDDVQSMSPHFDWVGRPAHLYLQRSLSSLMGAIGARTRLPVNYPSLSINSMGLVLVIELERHAATLGDASGRRCDVAILSVFLGHPRYAAMRHAALHERSLHAPETYRYFKTPLAALARGELDAVEADQLATDLVDHILKVGHCAHVRLDRRVEAAIHHTDVHQSYRLADIAKSLDISASRLSHLFTEHVGMSFRQYAVWCRAMQAWELVVYARRKTLTEVAHEMEFSDLAHMSRAFRLIFGATPSAIREHRNVILHGCLAERGRRAVASHEWPTSR